MITCNLCGCWLFSMASYCSDCHELRRLLLLHEKDDFISQVKDIFLKVKTKEHKEEKVESKQSSPLNIKSKRDLSYSDALKQ
ncbi:TPA_asm: hypothetical protein [Monosiga MELD virus 2]|nr:TPA_asm: hypothetical protein [Monosiga MELD virus 2]